jgi:hypothetical protein
VSEFAKNDAHSHVISQEPLEYIFNLTVMAVLVKKEKFK